MSNAATPRLKEYLFVSDPESWGVTTTAAKHKKLCELAEGWLTDHEPEHVSVEVATKKQAAGAIEGLYCYTGVCLIPWSDEKLDELVGKAMAYAWEML